MRYALIGLAFVGAAIPASAEPSRADDFQVSYAAGSRDEAGRFAGGTELRLLTSHGGRLPRDAPIPPNHSVVGVGYGQVESGGWYLVRGPTARYDLHQITAAFTRKLVATRTIRLSPFPGDIDAIYFGGYDANKAPARNTAWIARATLSAALRAPP